VEAREKSVEAMLLKGLRGLSFLWLGVSVYQAYQGHELTMLVLLWVFALTMMAQKLLSYQCLRKNLNAE
jgi:uncharacterized membrane protein